METAPRITVFLGVNYHTSLGEVVTVVGNIPELGNWQPRDAFWLKYHEGGNWAHSLKLEKSDQVIEYKYVVYNQFQDSAKWEEGPNRILDLSNIKPSKKELFNIEVWGHRELCIRIKYDCGPKETLAICGDLAPLGNWRHPSKMALVLKKDPLTGQKTTYWQKTLNIRPDIKRIKYRFVLIHEEEDMHTWEREPDRVCDLDQLANVVSSDETDHYFPNKKDSIKFVRKQNKYIKYDCNFVSKLFYNLVTDSIIIGPYPQNQDEIENLSKQGVRAVLNLQTRHDMKYRSIDWDLLTQYYYMTNIKALNFAITDMCAEDLFLKAYDGAIFLKELIEKYKSVYVHCTAGIGRAPHVVASYLIFFKGYSVDDAIAYIKEKRPIAYLNRDVLLKIQAEYFKRVKSLTGLSDFAEKNNLLKKEDRTENITVSEANIASSANNIPNGLGV